MLNRILRSIQGWLAHNLAFFWRIAGSPRIAGDDKVASTLKNAWENRERPVEGVRKSTSGMSVRARNWIITVLGVLFAIVLVWVVMSVFGGGENEDALAEGPPTPTPFAGPEYMNEIGALSLAIAAARDAGLVSQNFEHIARRIQFVEYAEAIGEANRAERGLLKVPTDTEVWAFAYAGDVTLELDTGDRVDYDNLTVVLDALTGKIYRVEAFYGDYESEARAPVWLRPPTPTPTTTELTP